MPLSLLLGKAWSASRDLLRRRYEDLVCVSLAGARPNDLSFSADTGMGECLVVGKKTGRVSKRATFVVLNDRPQSIIEGTTIANQIRDAIGNGVRKLEDGPYGGTPLLFGDNVIGWALDAPLPEDGTWNLARIKDASLAQMAYQMTDRGLVWLPGTPREGARPISVIPLGQIWSRGPIYHMDINADTPTGGIRGPFRIDPLEQSQVPTYPACGGTLPSANALCHLRRTAKELSARGLSPRRHRYGRRRRTVTSIGISSSIVSPLPCSSRPARRLGDERGHLSLYERLTRNGL